MSANSSQRRVRQRTEEARATSLAKVENMQVVSERNVLRADAMVTPLDCIADIRTITGAIYTTVLAQFILGW
jgi:hypothetical protein